MEESITTSAFNLVNSENIYFSVELSDLRVENHTVDGFTAVYRPDIQKTLAIHRDGYSLLPNESIYPVFEEALESSELNTNGMQSFFELCCNGAKTVGHYIFPAHMVEPFPGEKIYLHLKLISTYDGSLPLSSSASGWDMNANIGIVFSDSETHKYGKKSNRQIRRDTIVNTVNLDLRSFIKESQLWEYWAHLPVSENNVNDVGYLLCLVKNKNNIQSKHTHRAKVKLLELYRQEKRHYGATAWSLVKALNKWVYCSQFRKDALQNKATTILGRENKIIDILNHAHIMDLGQDF